MNVKEHILGTAESRVLGDKREPPGAGKDQGVELEEVEESMDECHGQSGEEGPRCYGLPQTTFSMSVLDPGADQVPLQALMTSPSTVFPSLPLVFKDNPSDLWS